MAYPQFDQFLREVLKLPMAVFEGPSFGYTEQASRTCFAQQVRAHLPPRVILVNLWLVWRRRCGGIVSLLNLTSPPQKKVSLNTFLDTLMSDPPPQCLVWLPLMHRLANVENGKTPRGIFRNRRAGRGLGGCKVQPCIIILTHHAHKQPNRHIQGTTDRHTHTHTHTPPVMMTHRDLTPCVWVCACAYFVMQSSSQVTSKWAGETHPRRAGAVWLRAVEMRRMSLSERTRSHICP